MLKLDGCHSSQEDYETGYPNMTRALNATGRPIVFSCSWPAYQQKVIERMPLYWLVTDLLLLSCISQSKCISTLVRNNLVWVSFIPRLLQLDLGMRLSVSVGYVFDIGSTSLLCGAGWNGVTFCSLPQPNYTEIAHYCNLWRNYVDISVRFFPPPLWFSVSCLIPRPCIRVNMSPGNETHAVCINLSNYAKVKLHLAKCV